MLALSIGILAGFITAYILLTPDLMYLARFADPHTSGEMEGVAGPLIGKKEPYCLVFCYYNLCRSW